MADLRERYVASLVLSGLGDAMGYRWEFEYDGQVIFDEMMKLTNGGGISALSVAYPKWIVSDDTVMEIGTAQGLIKGHEKGDVEQKLVCIASEYWDSFDDMDGRAPGNTCAMGVETMGAGGLNWRNVNFRAESGGCGAAMRSMPIGLYFARPDQINDLVMFSIESGRMTHHSGTGYLGSLASALFVSYALQGVPLYEWGWRLLEVVEENAKAYIRLANREVERNLTSFDYFIRKWTEYLRWRKITKGATGASFPLVWGIPQREAFIKWVSFDGWGGSSGHDAPLISYDALLWSGNSWEKLCHSAILHGGDNDSTGCIAGAIFGALYGFQGVPPTNYKNLEYHTRLESLGNKLYELTHPQDPQVSPASADNTQTTSTTVSITLSNTTQPTPDTVTPSKS
ncbi:protein ADP-ribosylarginine hydrolase [Pelomyxa schiedti]|nr:protein ADP-ribosylarginine hydrolase [Pelomyxa schiedti]